MAKQFMQVRIPADLSRMAQIRRGPFAKFILSGAEGLKVTEELYPRNYALPKNEQKLSSFWAGKWTGQNPTLRLLIFTDFFGASVVLGLTKLPYAQWSDEILAAQVAKGDVAALEALYDRHAPLILGMTLKITGEQALSEKVLQETFWLLWESASTYPSQSGSFKSWLFRLARSLALEANGKASSTSDR